MAQTKTEQKRATGVQKAIQEKLEAMINKTVLIEYNPDGNEDNRFSIYGVFTGFDDKFYCVKDVIKINMPVEKLQERKLIHSGEIIERRTGTQSFYRRGNVQHIVPAPVALKCMYK
jgi:hypothetical protein